MAVATIRYATREDLPFLSRDIHISRDGMIKKLVGQEVLLCKLEQEYVGWLRFNYFWDSIPFLNMIYLEERFRRQGFGSVW